MIKFIIQFLFYSVILYNLRVNADDADIIASYAEKVSKCPEGKQMSPKDMELFDTSQMPESENARCLTACIYKITGMIDDQGMFSVEGVHEIARLFMSEDPERQKKADHFVEACLSVNDVEVSDGDKGCERAALIFKCRLENAPEYVCIK